MEVAFFEIYTLILEAQAENYRTSLTTLVGSWKLWKLLSRRPPIRFFLAFTPHWVQMKLKVSLSMHNKSVGGSCFFWNLHTNFGSPSRKLQNQPYHTSGKLKVVETSQPTTSHPLFFLAFTPHWAQITLKVPLASLSMQYMVSQGSGA